MPSTNDKQLTEDEIEELYQNYIKNDSDAFISKFQKTYLEYLDNYDSNTDLELKNDFETLYKLANKMNPAALPYAEFTTLIFNKDDEGESTSFFIYSLENFYKEKFSQLRESSDLKANDYKSISVLAKSKEHLNLALGQKKTLYLEQKTELIELNKELAKEKEDLKKLQDQSQEFVEEYKKKYDKMTIDFLSMMGIFSTIIFAVFGGLSQIGAIGDNLAETPISKILMYISLSSITLILVVFLSFNAISKLTNMKLRSCPCKNTAECNHAIYKKHPSLCFALFFFVDLFVFSIVLRATRYSDWSEPFNELLKSPFGNPEFTLKTIIIVGFLLTNILLAGIFYYSVSRKKRIK